MTARAMGRVLIDHARERKCLKRGGVRRRVPLDDVLDVVAPPRGSFEDLHEAIARLKARHG